MNSPHEPASPTESTPSSGTPPPETEHISDLVQNISHTPSIILYDARDPMRAGPAIQAKRRLPSGSTTIYNSRDPKARRRDDGGSVNVVGMRATGVGGLGETGRTKDELLDVELMDKLKNEFGDSFDDSAMNI